MIATGIEMFRREGYQSCSWRKLVEKSGAPWGSAYHYFPQGKEQLGVAVIERAAQLGAAWIARSFEGQASAAEGITAVLRGSAQLLGHERYQAGCPIAVVILERGSHSPALTAACAAAFESWRRQLAQALEARGFEVERASGIALITLVVLEGCLVLARAAGSTEAFEVGLATLLAQLGEQGQAGPVAVRT
ncbi:TetR/AcrR family transcriptional regulator [Cupriavidus basilensis]|uniref:TetR/AcrR family transcriptional regulator n=1 Tax=Cupriavidus basilensis TaxID=68895 RepID=A0ABT6AJH5_9BURK|nr:TetR/AcrR family transcriptional regulator [Cupriavidus basilensis]MDF3832743.1 TetR/AcrR family transcriptional regulator [Cupriavidus basilensis]